jgi:Uma2 family endonuclease
MTAASKRQSVYEQFLAAPPTQMAEIVNGTVRVQPRPASPHARAASRLGARLGPFDPGDGGDGPGGWAILDEPELRIGGHIVVPDLAGWRRERMPEIPDVPFFELVPDWICEVLSPSTAALDRTEKAPIYAEWRVGHLWFLDPLARTLEVLALDHDTGHAQPAWRVLGASHGDVRVRAEPFEVLELNLAALWAR